MFLTSNADINAIKRPRLQRLDLLRALGLIGMMIFHFSWDLSYFGYISEQSVSQGWLVYFARIVAGSFVFFCGFSLYLAHGHVIRWGAFFKRLSIIILAACLVSFVTYILMPNNFIYFGILHEIALTSLVALLFLRTPLLVNIVVVVGAFYAPQFLPAINSNLFLWLGLNPAPPATFDYVPFFPWFSVGLLGLTVARVFDKFQLFSLLQGQESTFFLCRFFRYCGRHTLLIYLVHQPIFLAGFFIFSALFPPQAVSITELKAQEVANCQQVCEFSEEECARFCSCAFNALYEAKLLDDFLVGAVDLNDSRIDNIRKTCLVRDQ